MASDERLVRAVRGRGRGVVALRRMLRHVGRTSRPSVPERAREVTPDVMRRTIGNLAEAPA